MPRLITIDIDPEGNVSIDDDRGQSADVVRELENALGTVTDRKKTCSAPRQLEEKQQLKQRG